MRLSILLNAQQSYIFKYMVKNDKREVDMSIVFEASALSTWVDKVWCFSFFIQISLFILKRLLAFASLQVPSQHEGVMQNCTFRQ